MNAIMPTQTDLPEPPTALSPEAKKARSRRNVAIALALAAFALLFFVITIVKLGGMNAAG